MLFRSVYQLQLEELPSGKWKADGYYGRRGQALKNAPLSSETTYEEAKEAFDKKLKAQKSKGYTEDQSGATYVGGDLEGRKTDLVPQLLNPIEEGEVEQLMKDARWILQEKMDGVRAMVRIQEEGAEASNRRGLVVPLVQPVSDFFKNANAPVGTVHDGEMIGDVYWLFDLLQVSQTDLRQLPYRERWSLLQGVLNTNSDSPNVRIVRSAIDEDDKRRLYDTLVAERAEGVVFKRLDSLYHGGRPASGGSMVKFKFYASATCIVAGKHSFKRSVELAVQDLPHKSTHLRVGNCTIPPNYDMPEPGDLVEIKYLYYYPGGSLYQPQYRGVRTDKTVPDSVETLKPKATDTDEEN